MHTQAASIKSRKLVDIQVARAEVVSPERARPKNGTLPQVRVLFPSQRHLDVPLASVAVGVLSQMVEMMKHTHTILVQLSLVFMHVLLEQILNTCIRLGNA